MKKNIPNDAILKRRLLEDKNNITFVFGSAISKKQNGIGIPDVSEIEDLLREKINNEGLCDDYKDYLIDMNWKDNYQTLFSFISDIYGQDKINKIINKIIQSNINPDTKKHQITKAINDFILFIKNNNLKVINIITTNFDTLLEEACKEHDIEFNSISIVFDSRINKNRNERLNIIHIHGVWDQNDTMHTYSQLDNARKNIESSLLDLFIDTSVYIMAYGGWLDSFTRSLADVVNKEAINYNIAWGFFSTSYSQIRDNNSSLLEKLNPAFNRGRLSLFRGVNVNNFFEDTTYPSITKINPTQKKNIKQNPDAFQNINFTSFDKRKDYTKIRIEEQQIALRLLEKEKHIFIRAGLGYGILDFIFSIMLLMNKDDFYFLDIDLKDIFSKKQLERKIKSVSGQNDRQLINLFAANPEKKIVIHYKNISNEIDLEALEYLKNLMKLILENNINIQFVFSSNSLISAFNNVLINLNPLSLQETSLVLKNKFYDRNFTTLQLDEFHQLSEGIIKKLDQVISYLEKASINEVLEEKDDLFKNDIFFNEIPNSVLKQIERLKNSEIFGLIKILAVLKNGESLKNIRKSKMGLQFKRNDLNQIVDIGLAKSIIIDDNTSITKLDTILKDYIISLMSEEEIFNISKEYLDHTVIETNKMIKINSINKKVLIGGFSTEDDNGIALLLITLKGYTLFINEHPEDESIQHKLNNLIYRCKGYILALQNFSMYKETISSCIALLNNLTEKEDSKYYRYYEVLASSFRMLGNYNEAQSNIDKCKGLCPEDDKATIANLYIEQLYLYEKTDLEKAIQLAQKEKNKFKRNSLAYIVSEEILSKKKNKQDRLKKLKSLYKKARKFGYHTTANNIIMVLNLEASTDEKLISINEVLSTESNVYNQCRAIIQKYEIYIKNDWLNKIQESDIQKLVNVYKYLFTQGFDYLFRKCHYILWDIAEYIRNQKILIMLYFQGRIVWILNEDKENEEKYQNKFNLIAPTFI